MQSANPPEQQPVQYEDLDPIPMQEIRIPPEPMLIIATQIPSLKPVEVVVKKWPLSKLPRIPENHPEGRSVQSNDPKSYPVQVSQTRASQCKYHEDLSIPILSSVYVD